MVLAVIVIIVLVVALTKEDKGASTGDKGIALHNTAQHNKT